MKQGTLTPQERAIIEPYVQRLKQLTLQQQVTQEIVNGMFALVYPEWGEGCEYDKGVITDNRDDK